MQPATMTSELFNKFTNIMVQFLIKNKSKLSQTTTREMIANTLHYAQIETLHNWLRNEDSNFPCNYPQWQRKILFTIVVKMLTSNG